MTQPLYEMKNVSVEYQTGKMRLAALKDISLSGESAQTIGVVGESGCGKSTLGKALLYLEKPTSGKVHFEGSNLAEKSRRELRHFRKNMQMIFQDPSSSFNPRMTILAHLQEALVTHGLYQNEKEIDRLLEMVQINAELKYRYPFELSGGQKQRISIARALSSEPKLLVLDEPLSSLDVSIRSQIIKLLIELQERQKVSYLFITHDLATLPYLAHKIAVLYLGSIVEFSSKELLYRNPLHPYTKALLSAVAIPDPEKERKRSRLLLTGEMPSPLHPPAGCPFVTRCPYATELCKEKKPELRQVQPNQLVACHHV